jgi:hypothetical protein
MRYHFCRMEREYAYRCREFAFSTIVSGDVYRLQKRAVDYLRNALAEFTHIAASR